MIHTDTAIIGAGPIGLELAVALKQAGVDYLHFDAKQIGHTISWFAPGTHFFSSNERIAIAGVPLQTEDQSKATREQYLCYLRTVVQLFDLKIRTYEPVANIERLDGGFVLTTRPAAGEQRYRARRLVLATGGMARPRRLRIPGEDLPHVSHYLEDPHKYFGRRVLIVGGMNSAIEAALRLYHVGARVAISYRRDAFSGQGVKYWLLPEITARTESGRIPAHFRTVPLAIAPTHVTLQKLGQEGTPIEVPADFVLLLVGYEADMSLFRMAGVELTGPGEAPVFDEQTMQTNVPGVYVAGTATGGTQDKYRIFIENCHIHTKRIAAALTGAPPPAAPRPQGRPES